MSICYSCIVTIPRVIVRDLGDHANKKELIAVFSRFSSFKNVWVANNPPGFAYVFFNDMKEALKAVASTNGRYLCGGRVRVELTPIDEKEDVRRHASKRLIPGRRSNHMMRSPTPPSVRKRSPSPGIRRRVSHRTPSPSPFSHRNVRYTPPESPMGSPIVRHKRYHHASPTPPPPPKRRSSRHDYNQSFDRSPSPVRGRIHRRMSFPSSPPHDKAPLPRKREPTTDRRYHGDNLSDYPRPGKRDYRRSSETYGRDRQRSPPFDSVHLSRSNNSYERKHRTVKDDRGTFEPHDTLFQHEHFMTENNDDIEFSYFDAEPVKKGLSMEEEQEEWSLAAGIRTAIEEELQYYKKDRSPSPPSPPPLPRSSKRRNSTDYGFSSYGHCSPSPPPLPPLPRKKSYRVYDSPPERHHHDKDLRSSHHRHDDHHDKDLRRKISKDTEHHSRRHSRQSREDRGSTSSRHHRSRSPIRYNNNGSNTRYTGDQEQEYGAGARYSPPRDDGPRQYHRKTAAAGGASPREHQYYEQIEDSTDRGFFSEIGYHSQHTSPEPAPADYVKTHPGDEGDEPPLPTTQQHQVFGNLIESARSITQEGPSADGYEHNDRSVVEHFLQIDEVKGSTDDHVGHKEEGGPSREVYRHRSSERKIVISGGHRKKREREVHKERDREVHKERDREVHREREVHKERDREVHRKRDREVVVKRSPPSPRERKNRSRSRTPPH